MKTTMQLPEGYRLLQTIDLEKNRRQMIIVNVLALIVAVVAFIPMVIWEPDGAAFVDDLPEVLLLFAGMLGYVVLHEAMHGVCFRIFSGERPHFGWKSAYAYAASDAYYPR